MISRWDAASLRVLRSAEALFGAADLSWFVRMPSGLSGDTSAELDQLIRAVLKRAADGSAVVAESASPARTRTALRAPAAIPPERGSTAAANDNTHAVAHAAPPATTTARGPLSTARQHAAPPRSASRVEPPGPLPLPVGRGRIAALTSGARAADRTARVALPPRDDSDDAATDDAPTDAARPEPRRLPAEPSHVTSPHRARVLDFLEAPHGIVAAPTSSPSSPTTSMPSRSAPVGPAVHTPAQTNPALPTRLVDGLPALQNLLQAAVAESRQYHTSALVERPSEASPSLPLPAMSPAAAPALRALASLDAVAEDMLVDRVCDRLQERLREQALRQFGFTGGLV